MLTQVGGLAVWLTTVTTPFPPTVTRGGGGGHAAPAAEGLVAGTLVTIDGPPLLVSSSTERSGQVKILNNLSFTIKYSLKLVMLGIDLGLWVIWYTFWLISGLRYSQQAR